jgi:hypothetical protein
MAYATRQPSPEDRRSAAAIPLARGLGWFSIALGAAEVIAPKRLSRVLGLEGRETLIRAYGLREVATGIAILSAGDKTPWIWGRVAGDALDLATLSAPAFDADNQNRRNVGIALAAVAGVTALDVMCGRRLSGNGRRGDEPAPDYSNRSGFPRPPDQMRGVALEPVTAG